MHARPWWLVTPDLILDRAACLAPDSHTSQAATQVVIAIVGTCSGNRFKRQCVLADCWLIRDCIDRRGGPGQGP